MIPAFIATLLWSFCVIASRRSLEQLGEIPANFWRMIVAVTCMGLVSHLTRAEFQAEAFFYLFLSGFVGFGIGDLGLYFALSRIGSRLTILMAQCAAVPVAFFIEWAWLGNLISLAETGAILVILIGIVMALLPRSIDLAPGSKRPFIYGIIFGLVAAAGQGGGAVLSRIAYQAQGTLNSPETTMDGILLGTAAGYQRLLGGLLVIGTVYLVGKFYAPLRSVPKGQRAHDPLRIKCSWIVIAAMTGPVVGITFFQWALMVTEAAIAQTIVALTPIVIMPLAYWFEGERPKPRSIIGGIIAVCGVILLALA